MNSSSVAGRALDPDPVLVLGADGPLPASVAAGRSATSVALPTKPSRTWRRVGRICVCIGVSSLAREMPRTPALILAHFS